MADKKDFMSELAREIEDKKAGKIDEISVIGGNTHHNDLPVQPQPPIEEEYEEEEEYEDEEYEEEEPVRTSSVPESFAEEKLVKVEKPKREIKPIVWVGLGLLGLLALFLIYWFFIAAHIVVPDFVGKNVSEVSTWARQNQMESGVVAMSTSEYSLEYDKDIVIRQSVEPGKKVKKNTPITITVSNGPDPDEEISFPDITHMNMEEINEWKNDNKLLKTKVTTQYSDTVEEGNVISYEVRNGSESNFTRGTTLNVICSKGKTPAGQVTIEDFKNKTYAEIESWASRKKVNLEKREVFSDTAAGAIVSLDKQVGTTINEGDTIVVVVSKGKGVTVPNLVGYTKEQLEAWSANKDNNVVVVPKSIYHQEPAGTVIGQSIQPGSTVEQGSVLELTISLYYPILQTNSQEWIGKDFLQLKAWVDDVNSKGARIQAGPYFNGNEDGECPSPTDIARGATLTPGAIIEIACYYATSDVNNGCSRPLTLDSRIAYRFVKYDGSCNGTPTPTPSAAPVVNPIRIIVKSDLDDATRFNGSDLCKDVSCTFLKPSKEEIDAGGLSGKKITHIQVNGTPYSYDTFDSVWIYAGDNIVLVAE